MADEAEIDISDAKYDSREDRCALQNIFASESNSNDLFFWQTTACFKRLFEDNGSYLEKFKTFILLLET